MLTATGKACDNRTIRREERQISGMSSEPHGAVTLRPRVPPAEASGRHGGGEDKREQRGSALTEAQASRVAVRRSGRSTCTGDSFFQRRFVSASPSTFDGVSERS